MGTDRIPSNLRSSSIKNDYSIFELHTAELVWFSLIFYGHSGLNLESLYLPV